MTFPRLLALGLLLSVLLHSAGSAYFAKATDEVMMEASAGGGVSVIGSIEDMISGSKFDAVEVREPVEEVEPELETVDPVETPEPVREVSQPVEAAAVQPVEAVSPQKVSETAALSAAALPVVEGVTSTDAVTSTEEVREIVPEDARPVAEVAVPLEAKSVAAPEPVQAKQVEKRKPLEIARSAPVTPPEQVLEQVPEQQQVKPVEAQKPVEIARAVVTEPVPVQEAIKPDTRILEAVPEALTAVTKTPAAKPEPPVRKIKKKQKKKKKPVQQAQKKGAEADAQKGGQKITSQTAHSNANGRKNARSEDGGDKAKANYRGKVQAKLQRAKRYPKKAKRKKLKGIVRFSFVIAPDGSVSGIRIRGSSGNAVLDQAALDMIRRASPMPKFPKGMRLNKLPFDGAIKFDPRA